MHVPERFRRLTRAAPERHCLNCQDTLTDDQPGQFCSAECEARWQELFEP